MELASFVLLSTSYFVLTSPSYVRASVSRLQREGYQRLHGDLLNRPVAIHKIPPGLDDTENSLKVLAMPIDILNVNDVEQVMSVIMYLKFTWSQPDLAWNISEYADIKTVLIDSQLLWTPFVYTIIGTGDSLALELSNTLEVNFTGQVSSFREYHLNFKCKIDFKKYPFDSQSCKLGFSVMSYSDLDMNTTIQTYSLDFSNFYKIGGEWSLVSIGTLWIPAQGSINHDFEVIVFNLKRRPVYYVITIIFPLVLTSLMIPLVFLIPPETGEKISYLVAIFTSTAIFLNFICNVMPRELLFVPYLAVLLIEVLVEGWIATLASLVVVKKFCQEEKMYKLTRRGWLPKVKRIQVSPASEKIDHDNPDDQGVEPGQGPVKELPASEAPGITSRLFLYTSVQLDQALLVCFSLAQICFLIVLFCVVDWL